MNTSRIDHQDIRIGTLVNGNARTADTIAQILPHGFESFQITFWQQLGGCDLKALAKQVNRTLDGTGAVISSLGIFGNPLDPSAPKHKETLKAWKTCIDNARLFGADLVCGFAGRVIDKPIDQSMKAYKKVFGELSKRAADKGVRLAFENCCMGGSWKTGDWNIAQYPAAWELMFNELPAANVGLEW